MAAVNKLCFETTGVKPKVGDILQYVFNGHEIIHCYDPPHLIKALRNNLLTKNIKHFINHERNPNHEKASYASWDDVSELYDYDRCGTIRLLPKITHEHIDPKRKKMKVSHATQVVSATFGKVMLYLSERNQLPRDFSGTAEVLLFFNDLFDSLNCSFKMNSGLKGPVIKKSPHFKLWQYAITVPDKMIYVKKGTDVKDNYSPSLKNFSSTVKGFMAISTKLFEKGIKRIALRRVNQDRLENFFGSVRSYTQPNNKPNCTQFSSSFLALLLNNLLSKKSIHSNCESDHAKTLLSDFQSYVSSKHQNLVDLPNELQLDEVEFEMDDIIVPKTVPTLGEFSSTVYVAGFFCRKLSQKISCQSCINNLLTAKLSDSHSFITVKDFSNDNSFLSYPSENFISSFNSFRQEVDLIIPHLFCETNIKDKILSTTTFPFDWFNCFQHKEQVLSFISNMCIKFFLRVFCKKVNDILTGKNRFPVNPNLVETKALNVFVKKSKAPTKFK